MSSGTALGGESIGIVICTRNRPDDLGRCIEGVARSMPPGAQLVVVDQSEGDTADKVKDIVARQRSAAYLASGRKGLSVARNQGIAYLDRKYLLCTDDDCEVEPGWAGEWIAVLEREPSIGIGFGTVTQPAGGDGSGFTPTYDPANLPSLGKREFLFHGFGGVGMGANMVVRRQAWAEVGGFDELLGAGARFPGSEEIDMAIKIARTGYKHVHDGRPSVVHYGIRRESEASQLARSYALGNGAMLAKLTRCGDLEALLWTCGELSRRSQAVIRNLLRRSKPLGFRHFSYFVRGMATSSRYQVDSKKMVYIPGQP